MLRGCVIMRHGEGERVSVALPVTQPRHIKLKIYVVCSQCLKYNLKERNRYLDLQGKLRNTVLGHALAPFFAWIGPPSFTLCLPY